MSGGRWNYQDSNFCIDMETKLPAIFKTLWSCFHHVDLAESGDTDSAQAKEHLYKLINDLGNEIFDRR